MSVLTIYLSGPMKGYPEGNYPLFIRVAAELRAMGHMVYNPAEFADENGKQPWRDKSPSEWKKLFPIRKAFAAYSKFICEEASAIVLLPGWEKSVGVSAELALAKNCGLLVIHWHEDGLLEAQTP